MFDKLKILSRTNKCSVTLTDITNKFDFVLHFLSRKRQLFISHKKLRAAAAVPPVGATLFQHWHKDVILLPVNLLNFKCEGVGNEFAYVHHGLQCFHCCENKQPDLS